MRRLVLPALLLLVGCQGRPSEPEVESGPRVPVGVSFREIRLDGRHRLWIYKPTKPGSAKLPCVIIAPAGAHGFDGMLLGDGDRDEQFPYARAGYVVVAYDVSGPLRRETRSGIKEAATEFLKADLGLRDAHRALDWAKKDPMVDPKRIVTAGHSSAATLSLMLAEDAPEIAACLAYAPVVDQPSFLRPTTRQALQRDVPGLMERLAQLTPAARVDRLKCPTLVFHAADDEIVPGGPLESFVASAPQATLRQVESGGHYASMIKEGIPAGLDFLQEHKISP